MEATLFCLSGSSLLFLMRFFRVWYFDLEVERSSISLFGLFVLLFPLLLFLALGADSLQPGTVKRCPNLAQRGIEQSHLHIQVHP